jgi:tetratricopeptide (TPR) repeat protein
MYDANYDSALGCFRECIARDPEMALGHVGLSRALYGGLVYGFSRDPQGDLAQAYEAAKQGAMLDPSDAQAFYALAGSLLLLRRHGEALDAAERAIGLNPNFAYGYFRLGQILIYYGRAQQAVAPIERSVRHNPYDPRLGTMLWVLSIAEHHCGNFERAIELAQGAMRHDEWRAAATVGASLARLGRFEEARAAFPPETFTRLASDMRLLTYANAADLAYAIEGMRMAANGGP